MDEVDFLNGRTQVYGIVGDPIEQVRSPEMVTHELHLRGINAILIPIHIRSSEFELVMPQLLKVENIKGLIFTIPFKVRAIPFATLVGPQATAIGAINAMARVSSDSWAGEIFDGLGCVEAFRQRGYALAEKNVMLIGLGGAGAAIAAAIAGEEPASMRVFDVDPARCTRVVEVIRRISPGTLVTVGKPCLDMIDVLLNASPVGMLDDSRLPIEETDLNPELIVFDAIVRPEQTPLLALAESRGCRIVRGREMMRGQISRIVDYFIDPTYQA